MVCVLDVPALSLPLNGCGDSPDTAPTHPDIASSSSEATASSTAQQSWTLLSDEPEDVPLAAGDYALTINGAARNLAVVRAPEGFTVADLAEALVAQKGAQTSAPAPVTIDGHSGLHLEYRVSDGVDVAGCEDRAFDIFTTGPGGWYL